MVLRRAACLAWLLSSHVESSTAASETARTCDTQKLVLPTLHISDEGVGLLQTGSHARKPSFQLPGIQVHAKEATDAALTSALKVLSNTSQDTSRGPPAVQGNLASLLALQTGLNHTALIATSMDEEDGSVIFYCMVLMGVFYLLAGVVLRVNDDKPPMPADRTSNTYQRQRPATWARADPQFLEEALPAISGFLLARSADVPLLISIKDLEARQRQSKSGSGFFGTGAETLPSDAAWSIDINSSKGKKIMAVRQIRLKDGQLGPLEIVGRHSNKGPEKRLAMINAKLQLFGEDGSDFGKLVLKKSGAYELKESATGRHRWLITPDFTEHGSEFFAVTWRPRRRLLATVSRGQDKHVDFMKVMNTNGVDAVLVTLCTLGLYVFRLDLDPHKASQLAEMSEDNDDEADLPMAHEAGAAGSLLMSA